MKKYLALITLFATKLTSLTVFADGEGKENTGILGGKDITQDKLRNGEIHLNDIPHILKYAIDFLLGFAGTVSVLFIIIGAYQILFGSISQEKTKGRDTIIMALAGFALASLSRFLLNYILSNYI
ncbi:MAG: hypothetical protein N4A38_04095 [Candidatus Gracilibacteria bacterium]|nr:hypothetical protein [Candidatus Gracilibacteria bacterium]